VCANNGRKKRWNENRTYHVDGVEDLSDGEIDVTLGWVITILIDSRGKGS
jgi:hypothetical protein